ncbi:MAG TPA: ADOP family duplicated permease [Vicinamibacterales bacterium]|nr:ADOP family duplicated permease [Vicinamibacterales bacterium]
MWRDVRFALRSLRRSATFSMAAVLALALAIGANGAIFSLIDGLWFRPPGIRNPGAIVRVFSTTPSSPSGLWSYPEYTALRDQTSAFDGVIARGGRGALLMGKEGQSTLLLVNVVSTNFFTTLGVTPAYGRLFGPGDESSLEKAPGVVLGHAFWQRHFGGNPSVIGQTLILGGKSVGVLAVLPSSFREIDADADRDLWMPPATWTLLSNANEFTRRDSRWFTVLARRQPGVPVAAADTEVSALAGSLARDFPESNRGRGARVISDFDYRIEQGGVNAVALIGLVFLVVVITCVNVANLLLARAAGRTRELAVRVALGAGRKQLLRQLMIESALLGAAGAAAGLIVAMWLIRLLPTLLVAPPGFQSPLLFATDSRVVLFTMAVTVLTTVLFGLVPSVIAARTDVVALVKAEPLTASPGRRGYGLGGALVVAQVAVSLVLLSVAAVLTKSFFETGRADLGFSRKPLLTVWATQSVPRAVGERAMAQLTALPGVKRVAAAVRAPLSLSGGGRARAIVTEDMTTPPASGYPQIKFNAVSATYFETLGIAVRAGRAFAPADDAGGELSVVVNEQFATEFYAGRSPIGRVLHLGTPAGPPYRIIGVVANTVINQLNETPEPYFYVPLWRDDYGELTFLIETTGDPAGLAPAVRATVKGTDARLDPRQVVTMAQYVAYSASSYQATAALSGALGLVGLLLTGLGVYGVVASRAVRRTREIGIRVALGAARGQVLRLVLAEGARVGLTGVAIGVPAALAVNRVVRTLLLGVDPWDGPALAMAVAALLAALAAATFVPAWRAMHTNPSTALRDS